MTTREDVSDKSYKSRKTTDISDHPLLTGFEPNLFSFSMLSQERSQSTLKQGSYKTIRSHPLEVFSQQLIRTILLCILHVFLSESLVGLQYSNFPKNSPFLVLTFSFKILLANNKY